jgi:16S rRNA (cytosine967-C5)-methyltransferase
VVAVARRIATQVLQRLEQDQAWAAPTLDAEIRRASAQRADAALATQIVYGTLRVLPSVDAGIERHAKRPDRIDPWTRAALRAAVFQLFHLDRLPSHAIVDDTVALVRGKRGRQLAGFANAVLRKLAKERPDKPAPPGRVEVAPWLHAELERSLGTAATLSLLDLSQDLPSIDLRVRADLDRDVVAQAIREARAGSVVEPTALAPQGLRVRAVGDPRTLPGYQEGHFAVQEEGAQLIGLLLGVLPGERVLDACAGRGGKTAQLAETLSTGPGELVAADLHSHRLEQIPAELERLRLKPERVRLCAVDWRVGVGDVGQGFDRILVDAPCTGLGTLRRRPEILMRTQEGDAARMGQIQLQILRRAASLLKPGGTLLFAVCSPLRQEGDEVADRLDLPGLQRSREETSTIASLEFGRQGKLVLGPGVPGAGPWADAYQMYRWVKVGASVDSSRSQR